MKLKLTIACIFSLSLLVGCAQVAVDGSASVSLMTFNVENLFDTTHDPGKDDYTYLPAGLKDSDEHRERCAQVQVRKWREQCLGWDWNEQVLKEKLRRVAAVIREGGGSGAPDIVVFQEVENMEVLNRLREEYLGDEGYLPPVLIEGQDLRGIDVGFLSRLPLYSSPKLHSIDFREIEEKRLKDTRGILQADFVLPDGQVLSAFAVHFPAPFHPYPLRIDSYLALNKLLDDLPKRRLAIAAGDFNTPAAEDREHQLLMKYAVPKWLIVHQEGCQDCPGTHYYRPKKEWSFLDMILVRKPDSGASAQPSWTLQPQRTRLGNRAAHQTDKDGYPMAWSLDGPEGVSDHWPLIIELARQ